MAGKTAVVAAERATENGDVLRRLFNFATILSLALLVVTVTMWVRSYWIADYWDWVRAEPPATEVLLVRGHVTARTDPNVGFIYGEYVRSGRFPDFEVARETTGRGMLLHRQVAARSIGDLPKRFFFERVDIPKIELVELLDGNGGSFVRPMTRTFRSTRLGFSLWFAALLLAIFPGCRFAAYLRSRSGTENQNLCSSCGYNLTASVSGVCPECGNKVAA